MSIRTFPNGLMTSLPHWASPAEYLKGCPWNGKGAAVAIQPLEGGEVAERLPTVPSTHVVRGRWDTYLALTQHSHRKKEVLPDQHFPSPGEVRGRQHLPGPHAAHLVRGR